MQRIGRHTSTKKFQGYVEFKHVTCLAIFSALLILFYFTLNQLALFLRTLFVVHILYPVSSPQSTFYTLSVFYNQSTFFSPRFIHRVCILYPVRSPQQIFHYTDRRIDCTDIHFLFHCLKYSIPTEKFYNQIQQNFVDFNQLSYTELIIKSMNSQNFSVNSQLLKFVSLCNGFT